MEPESNQSPKRRIYKPVAAQENRVYEPEFVTEEILHAEAVKLNPYFKYDEATKKLYQIVAEYVNKSPEFEKRTLQTSKGNVNFSLKKGLFVISTPGAGKSFLFDDILHKLIKYRKLTAYDIEIKYHDSGVRAIRDWEDSIHVQFGESKTVYNLYIDDLGRENQSIKFWGNEINFMDFIFDSRYRLFKRHGAITHATSNKQLAELKKHYTPQTFSRMFEMFNFIVMTDTKDFRMNLTT